MKIKLERIETAAIAALLLLSGMGAALAQEEDTNATTVAYWKLAITNADPNNVTYTYGIPDLATDVGQGTVQGTAPVVAVPASVQNLWILGPMAGNTTYPNDVPPASMFNPNHYFNAGIASWDCGVDEFSGAGGEVSCDNVAYGTNFDTPSYTEEIFFKTDYVGSNTPSLNTTKQTLIWNHKLSAYGEIQLNEESNGTNLDIGSLEFWAWNVQNYPFVRLTAAQNGGERFDDGQWHYVCVRYDGLKLTMDILAVNQDGTSSEAITYINAPLNPGAPGSQGPFEIGDDESGTTPFDGEINQVRFSSAALPADQLLANTDCNPATFAQTALTPSTNVVAAGAPVNIEPVDWFNTGFPVGNQMQGGPLSFQWLQNGVPVPGQTNIVISFPTATTAESGNYQLVASTPCDGSVTSAPIDTVILPALNLARWTFQSAFTTPAVSQASVADVAPYFNNVYNLITYNNSPNITGIGSNGEIPLTNDVPPTSMFINGNDGGTNSFDPAYLAGNDGVVFYPAGPDVFDFQTSFSLEAFFRTYGDQSANGSMELISQGSDGGNTVRYSLVVNQAAPGAISFHINNYSVPPAGSAYEDTNAGIQTVTLSNANYADGNWHYVLAQYDSTGNAISLNVANADGSGTNATFALPAGYGPLPNYSEGNLFVGRYRYPWSDDNRNFTGSISSVQVTAGLVTPDTGRLGFLPGAVVPKISGISLSGTTITIGFTGSSSDAATAFTVVGSSTVNGTYSPLSANITSLGGGNFQATVTLSGSVEFYRIKR